MTENKPDIKYVDLLDVINLMEYDRQDIQDLFDQFSEYSFPLTREDIQRKAEQEHVTWIVAFYEEYHVPELPVVKIIGIGMVSFKETLERFTGYIDDVVVNERFHRKGIAMNIYYLLEGIARARGAHIEGTPKHMELTCSKGDAQEMWESFGFIKRNTNVYRKKLD